MGWALVHALDQDGSYNYRDYTERYAELFQYRIADNGEIEGDAPPSPQTGCYVEEILFRGQAIPTWRF